MKRASAAILVSLLTVLTVRAQDNKPYNIVSVEPTGGVYVITYYNNPVGGKPDDDYEVSVRLQRESSGDFNEPMKFVTGDVGEGPFVGSNLKINWDYKRQFPRGLPYDDIVFELSVVKASGGGSWVYYVGGAAVAGGAAVFLLGKKSTTSNTSSEIPALTITRPN